MSARPKQIVNVTTYIPFMGDRQFRKAALAFIAAALVAACTSGENEQPVAQSTESNPTTSADVNLYEPPADLKALIDTAKKSVFLVECGDYYGTGWVIDTAAQPVIRPGRERTQDPAESSLVVTVHHVIDGCIKKPKKLTAYWGFQEYDLELLNWDKKTDIALLSMESKRPGLHVGRRPLGGAWALSLGFPLDFVRPVPLIGAVIDSEEENVVVQMDIQPGNSGSPMLNSDGEVIGTLKEAFIDQAKEEAFGWALANSLTVMCQAIFDCTKATITEPAPS